jgi:hypothetical protein
LFLDIPLPERVFILQKYRQIWNCWYCSPFSKISGPVSKQISLLEERACMKSIAPPKNKVLKSRERLLRLAGFVFIYAGRD